MKTDEPPEADGRTLIVRMCLSPVDGGSSSGKVALFQNLADTDGELKNAVVTALGVRCDESVGRCSRRIERCDKSHPKWQSDAHCKVQAT